jgi:hypothetical protein
VPKQLGQPLGRPPGGRREHDLRPLRRRQRDDGLDGERLAEARAAGQHRHPLRQRQPHRMLLLGGQLRAGAVQQPRQRLALVLNPIPHTLAASRYGSLRTTEIDPSPNL